MFRIKTVKIKPLIVCPQEPNKSKTSGKIFHNYVFKGNKKHHYKITTATCRFNLYSLLKLLMLPCFLSVAY